MNTFFSLVVPTKGVTVEMIPTFESFARSEYKNFEVILVDQNPPGTLDEIVARFSPQMKIRHFTVTWDGLSRARNFGAQQARGDVVCLPDDDAEIFPDTLSKAMEAMSITHCDVLFGRSIDREGKSTMVAFPEQAARLTLERHEGLFIEYTICFKRELAQRFRFNENVGPGRFLGAEEGHDIVLRMLKAGVSIFYSPEVRFYHPNKVLDHGTNAAVKRVFAYRCGMTWLCMKHKLYFKWFSRFIKVCLYLPYVFVMEPRKVRYYIAELLGLLTGFVVK